MKALGIDVGTTSVSFAVFSEGTGVLETRSFPNKTLVSSESWARLQSPSDVLTEIHVQLDRLLSCHPDIRAIGVTGQMHGIVYLDAIGEPVSPLYTWQDGRGDLPYDGAASWAQHLSQTTTYPLSTGYGMVTHFYNLRHGLVPENAAYLCCIGDYIAMKLAGLSAPLMEPSNAAGIGLYKLQEGCFDAEALRQAGIDGKILPQIIKRPLLGTGALGVPVYAAIGDNQAAFWGAVGKRQDTLSINVGTGSQIAVYSREYLAVPGLETRPFPGGGWLLVGAALCGGRSYALLESFFRQTVKMVTGLDACVYDAMNRALDEAGAIEDVPLAVTTFQGTRQDPALRGSISGIGTDNFTPIHFMHSVLHGMARELRNMYDLYTAATGDNKASLVGSGNGLRKNPHLLHALEDVFERPVCLSPWAEEAACGAALYAAAQENAVN